MGVMASEAVTSIKAGLDSNGRSPVVKATCARLPQA